MQDRTKAPLETYIDARPRKPKAKGRGFVTKPLPALGPTRKSDPAE